VHRVSEIRYEERDEAAGPEAYEAAARRREDRHVRAGVLAVGMGDNTRETKGTAVVLTSTQCPHACARTNDKGRTDGVIVCVLRLSYFSHRSLHSRSASVEVVSKSAVRVFLARNG